MMVNNFIFKKIYCKLHRTAFLIAISTYKRKQREVLNKIKMASVIAYEKDYGTSVGIAPPVNLITLS